MGAVYLVEHVHMRKRFALKVLLAEARENPEIAARFEREAIAAAHIEHPNVVAASDFGTSEEGFFFLVLEYVKGKSLRDTLDASGPMPPVRVLDIALQMGAALGKAHGLGIVHRDLKPENVMLVPREGESDLVKVLDFGIAKVPSIGRGGDARALTSAGAIFGTPEYISPEQAVGQTVDARADLYSFGIMLYELLTGKRPFDSEHVMGYLAAHLNTPVPPMRDIAPDVSVAPAIEEVVRSMLAKVPEDRPPSVKDAVMALERAVLGGTPSPVSVATHVSPAPPSAIPGSAGFRPEDASARTLLPGQFDGPTPKRTAGIRTWAGWAEAEARKLHEGLPPKVKELPTAAKAGALAVLLLVPMLVFLGLVTRGGTHKHAHGADGGLDEDDEAAEASVRGVSDAQLARAETEGADALQKLALAFPEDGRVLRAEVRAYRSEGRLGDALDALGKLGKMDEGALAEPATREIFIEAFDGDAQLSSKATGLAEGLGAPGVDLLLACVAKPAKARAKCVEALAKPAVREKATPAAKLVLELKETQSCQGKYGLLERAKESGDARLLPGLKPLTYTSGCGIFSGSDCWKCMRRDKKLPEAIAAIEGRNPKKP